MINYQNGKIYRVVCPCVDQPYIGSTAQSLKERFRKHKYKFYCGILCAIILIEDFPCSSKLELLIRERFWINYYNENGGTLNIQLPTRTYKEWTKDNKDKIKKYRIVNNDKIKKYRIDNKDKTLQYSKKFYEDNNEKIKEKYKKYYEKNKDKVIETHRLYKQKQRYIKTIMNFPINKY